jgi:hypothetical protein
VPCRDIPRQPFGIMDPLRLRGVAPPRHSEGPGLLAAMPLIVSLPFCSVRETDVWQAPRVLRTTGSERLTAERLRSAATIPYVDAGKFGDAGGVRRKILTAGTNA